MSLTKNKIKKEMDMTNGPMLKNILLFTIPIALTSVMQQLFHSVDMAVVGRFCGNNELAAVGSNSSVINLLVNLFMGFATGSNVVIGQLLGADKLKTAKKAVGTSIFIAAISGFIVMVMGIIFSPLLLKLISSPPEVIGLATIYLRIYFLGIPPLMIYNFAAAILRSRGETTKPFYCLAIGGVINVILNLIFVIVLHLSVAGVAIATSISNLISCVLIINILTKDEGPLGIKLKEISLDKFILSKILKIGFPMSIQSCLFPVSNMMIQAAINSLGTLIIASSAAAMSVESYMWMLNAAFSQAMISFVSQNYGAKNIKRCKEAIWQISIVGLVFCSLFNLATYAFLTPVLGLFTTDPDVIKIAGIRIVFMFLAFPTGFIMDNISSALKGLGNALIPTIVSIAGVCGLRIAWVKLVFPYFKTLEAVLWIYPISWTVVSIVLIIALIIVIKRIAKNSSKVEL